MIYIHPRIRIGVVLVLAFGISGVFMKYSQTTSETGAPHVEVKSIVADFSKQLVDSGAYVASSLQAIRLPQIGSLSSSIAEVTPVPYEGVVPTPSDEWLTAPTSPPSPPTSTPTQAFPTQIIPSSPILKPTLIPTIIKPTEVPKPTKPPKPTAVPELPPVTDDVRPGSSLKEILQEVEKRTCVPAALMMAIKSVETGERFKNDSAATIKIYNTYGWWKTGTGDPCYGFGYHTQIGIVPSDSVGAGTKCSSAIGNPTDIKIMGLLQVSEWEQEVTRKNTIKVLSKNIDRRVLFDNAVIFAWATKGRAGKSPQPSCSDWPEETVKLVAEKHHGVCQYDYGNGAKGNYCTKIWELYKSFK
ncbi:MAG: hypothetical protein NTZ55_00815 [Candidatus Roizmanbacteria bacterium]|nr:hypothetical protein [Candidatus Roizmanbacteria bacterium]